MKYSYNKKTKVEGLSAWHSRPSLETELATFFPFVEGEEGVEYVLRQRTFQALGLGSDSFESIKVRIGEGIIINSEELEIFHSDIAVPLMQQ